MKTLQAIAGPTYNPVSSLVQLQGYDEVDRLTPKMARQAAKVAFGHDNQVTIWDLDAHGIGYGYRLYAKSARKLQQ